MNRAPSTTPFRSKSTTKTRSSLVPQFATPSSKYHKKCGSEQARRRKRWSPYSKRCNNSFPTKSISLEVLPPAIRVQEKRDSCCDLNLSSSHLKINYLEGDKFAKNETSDVHAVWAAWYVYTKFMKVAWRNARESLSKQIHRAESSELHAKSTMVQVYSMKSQLKDDICAMREGVKEINTSGNILDGLEEERRKLLAEKVLQEAKIANLNEELDFLNQSVSTVDKESQERKIEVEKLQARHTLCKEELNEIKRVKASLDDTIQEMLTTLEDSEGNSSTLKNNRKNLELDINCLERLEKYLCERTANTVVAISAAEKHSKSVRREIEIAEEGGQVIQDQLNELRGRVFKRDTEIARLNVEVENVVARLAATKTKIESSEKSLWQRFKVFPSSTEFTVR